MDEPDLLTIGAGSAGMASAIANRELGLSVEIVEERTTIGGNPHHRIGSTAGAILAPFAPDYARGKVLAESFFKRGARLDLGTLSWRTDDDGRGGADRGGQRHDAVSFMRDM